MGATVQFSVNNAMEGTMILLLSILLVTCIWQKRLFLTTTPLIYLLSFSSQCIWCSNCIKECTDIS